MLNAAIVGAGRMGRIRAQAASQLGVRVLAVCDPELERARQLASTCGAQQACADSAQLPWEQLELLFLCAPPAVRQVGVQAIQRGIHLLVEKPLATSTAAAGPLLAALAERRVVTAVGYMNRYRTGVRALRRELQQQRVLGVVAHWAGGRYGVPWWADPERSGGPVNEQCTHLVDLCRFLVGEVDQVRVLAPALETDAPPASAAIALRFEGGALATILYSCEASEKLIGLRAYTAHREHSLLSWEFLPGPSPEPCADRNAVFLDETEAFVRAVRGDGQVLCDLPDAARTQRVVDDIVAQARASATGEH